MFDMHEELAVVHRDVAVIGSSGTVSVTVNRTNTSGVKDVCDALTKPERSLRWVYPVSGALQAGGDIRECQ